MKRLSLLLGTLFILSVAAPAAAGDRHICPATGCTPPEPPVLEVQADAVVCGDPRMWVRFENTGTVDTTVKWVFRNGNKTKGAPKRIVKRDLDSGQSIVLGPRWVLGKGYVVKMRNWNPGTEAWDLVLKFPNRRGLSWGQGDCPADRFGAPTWNDPRHSSR